MLLCEFFPWWESEWKAGEECKKKNKKRCLTSVTKFRKAGNAGILNVKKGERNDTLYSVINTACYKESLSLEDAASLAVALNDGFTSECGGPLEDFEVETIVQSAFNHAAIALEQKKEKNKALLTQLANAAAVPSNCATEPFQYDYSRGSLNDARFSGFAVTEMVLQRYGRYLVKVDGILYAFCQKESVWRCQKTDSSVVTGLAQVCIRDVLRDPAFRDYVSSSKDISKYLSHNFLTGVRSDVMVQPNIIDKRNRDFDAHTNLLFCSNGVLNLDTGELREASPDDYLLRRTEVKYDPLATCPEWGQFVKEIFQNNNEPAAMVEFLQDLFGYSLTGSVDRQKLYVHFGSGSNGKSKVLQALGTLMGEYGTMMAGTALARSKNAFQKELERVGAKIEGKRCVIIDDLDTATQWNEGIVKNLTSKKVIARKLYEEERDIPNRAKFHIGCNEQPIPESENFAIIRRLCLIPYNKQFEPSDEKEAQIQTMLDTEISGILNWAIGGYRKGRVEEPEEVKMSLAEYKREHFTTENIIASLFEKPDKIIEGSRENWHVLSDLVSYANNHLADHGKQVTARKLGELLTINLKLVMAKKKNKGIVVRGYYTILSQPKNTNTLEQLK